MALYFSGRKHAGENLADVMKGRAADLGPAIQMCDALSRNTPKLSEGAELLLANCLAHGRRQFVEVAGSFPDECRHVLETLGEVYGNDALAKQQRLSPEERLRFHQERSGPVMEGLQAWLSEQLSQHKVEPNSGSLDNNICERALKKAVLHRKNALFYKTMNGAQVGDLFMSLIHTCELNGVNSFDYLIELQRHAKQLAANPSQWMPWNYGDTLARDAEPG